jgi:hypothetical protein
VKKCSENGIPVFSLDDGTVRKNNVTVGVSVSYTIIGNLIGNTLMDIALGRTNAEDMPIISMENAQIHVNPSMLNNFSLTIPDNLISLIKE